MDRPALPESLIAEGWTERETKAIERGWRPDEDEDGDLRWICPLCDDVFDEPFEPHSRGKRDDYGLERCPSEEDDPPSPQARGWRSNPETASHSWTTEGTAPTVGLSLPLPTMGTPTRADAAYVRGFYGPKPIDLPCDVPPPPDWTPTPPTEAGQYPAIRGVGLAVELVDWTRTESGRRIAVTFGGPPHYEDEGEIEGWLWWPVAVKLPVGPGRKG